MSVSDKVMMGCRKYATFFEKLNRNNIYQLEELVTEDFYFEDPFNKLSGARPTMIMFDRMFLQVGNPKFDILSISWSEKPESAILKWRFTGDGGRIGKIDFVGLSELCFDDEGFIKSHVDYWDSGAHFYGKLPLVKHVINYIKKKLHG
ncbi:hypothetical protein GUA87_07125 [Sneathiella sp. P13V-1]|uniref:nuclear transport factor 2 family protein n=1 Tax=Sneathiella sp. P13V-1 TaxID=2697366 RepID=UPI00187B3597|nr:nuclear transport factor 2 family protein [Sneathiella sp. P13V-1]MBE7636613.1 hypothetical protein [Sneathiella sp. P13V-1]